jgi:O-antigen ligase
MLKAFQQQKQYWIAVTIFIATGIAAILLEQPIFIALPFLYIIIPIIFSFVIHKTEKIFWLLFITLPLSTELNITPSLGIDFPDELLLMLLTGLFFLSIMFRPKLFPIAVLKHPLFLLIVLQLFWLLVCTFFAVNQLLSIKFFLARIWFVIPFVVLPQFFLQSITQFKKLALYLLIPMAAVVVLCLVRHSFYQFSFEGIKDTLSPFFRNHVTYSAMLVCLLALLWCVRKLTPKTNQYRRWLNLGLAIGFIALFFAYSRGAWAALIFGIFTAIIIRQKIMGRILIVATIAIASLIGWLTYNNHYVRFAPDYQHTIFHSELREHLQSTTSLKDLSNAERFYRWVAGAKMFAERPITGFGPNNFYSNYKNYTADIFKTYVSDNPEHSTVHNYFLLTAVEQGFIGLLLFYLLLCMMLMHVQKLYNQFQNNFYRTVTLTTGIIISMIATINTMSDMIETDKIGSLFWLSIGVIIILELKLKEEKESIVS